MTEVADRSNKLAAMLEAYAAGPDEEDRDVCRECMHVMLVDSGAEPTALCHNCAQALLELLVEKYKEMKKLARDGWRSVESLAIAGGHRASEAAAVKALEELGDA
jgi:hypothetical protein